jgi:hypothetical protein
MALQPFVGPWPLFQFPNFYTVGMAPWTRNQPVARPLPAHRRAQTQNKRTQTSIPEVGFELTIPVFEWTETVHTSDRTATVIGKDNFTFPKSYIIISIHIDHCTITFNTNIRMSPV